MPSSIPHLGLAMVQNNVRLGGQLMGEDTVEFANSLRKAHRVEIVVESKHVFTSRFPEDTTFPVSHPTAL